MNHEIIRDWLHGKVTNNIGISGTNPITLFLQVFFDEERYELFQFVSIEDFDVVSLANVESSHTLDLIDIGVEVPNVVIALVGLNLVI